MDKWKLNIEFEANPSWEPLDHGCWTDCPLSILTHLSCECAAREAYRKYGYVICPLAEHGERITHDE